MFKPKAHGVPLAILAMAVAQASYAANAVNDEFKVVAGQTSYTFNVLANDQYDPATVVVTAQGSDFGSVTVDPVTHEITYTPISGTPPGNQDVFYYTVSDIADQTYGSNVQPSTAYVTVDFVTSPVAGVGPITAAASGASNTSTATMLDTVCAKSSNEVSDAVFAACQDLLSNINNPDFNNFISQISPDELLVTRQVVSSAVSSQSANLFQYQQSLHGGGTGQNVAVNGNSVRLQSYRGGAAGDQNSPWGIFATAHTDQSKHDSSSFESAYDSQKYGLTVGADYRFMPTLFAGAAMDWMRSNVTYKNNGGGVDSDLYSLTGFLTWYRKQFSVDMQLGYASGKFNTQRNMTFPVTAVATGDTNSNQYNLSLQSDWTWSHGPWTARPYLRVQYLQTSMDAYTEASNGPWAMQVGKQDTKQTSTSLGASLTYAMSFKWGVMLPGLKVSAINQSSNDYSPVTFHLVGTTGSDGDFTLKPDGLDNLYYQYELSSVFQLTNGLSTFLQLGMISGYSHLTSYQVSTGFHLEL